MPDEHHDELSAYLAGDLDAAAAADLERRLAGDPELAARLEALHDALVRLQALDEVEVPEGFGARLAARLDAETAAPGEAAEERAAGAVVDIGAERARRRALPWAPLGAVAAGIATLAVVVSVTGPMRGTDDMDVAGDAADAPMAMEAPAAESDMEAYDVDDEDVAVQERDSAADEQLGAPPFAPVVLDNEVGLPDEQFVRERYTGLAEAEGLLGLPRDEAEDRAAAARFAVQRSEVFSSGVHPGACLDVVTTAADGPVVVARVESAIFEDAPALVYVVASISQGAALDRLEVWVVEPDTCATRLFLTL